MRPSRSFAGAVWPTLMLSIVAFLLTPGLLRGQSATVADRPLPPTTLPEGGRVLVGPGDWLDVARLHRPDNGMGSAEVVDVADAPLVDGVPAFERAWRVTNRLPTEKEGEVQLVLPVRAPVAKGDVLYFEFWVRTIAEPGRDPTPAATPGGLRFMLNGPGGSHVVFGLGTPAGHE